jgi:hypothetical protein
LRLGIEDETGETTIAEDGGEYITLGTWRGEPLKWQVLAQEGDWALIITKDCVAVLPYQNVAMGVRDAIQGTWEKSSLRAWLNSSFYEEAFTGAEQARIQTTSVVNNDTSGVQPGDGAAFTTDGGSDTSDRVFLLSTEEANQYFTDNAARVAGHKWTAEEVVQAEEWIRYLITEEQEIIIEIRSSGGDAEIEEGYLEGYEEMIQLVQEYSASGQASWWLRSPGYYGTPIRSRTKFITINGNENYYGDYVDRPRHGVRPAMWITME